MDPARAVTELARVVRSGGRVVLFEPDFDTVVIDSPERATTRMLMNAFCDSMRSGWVGRQLFALAKFAGLTDIRVEPITWLSTELAEVERMLGLDRVIDQAVASGLVGADQAATWLNGLQAADAAGCFFWATTAFLVSGRRP